MQEKINKNNSIAPGQAADAAVGNDALLVETLSACMDGEGSDFELRRVLKVLADPSSSTANHLLGSWRRYHLVSASLKGQMHANPQLDLLAGMHARMALDEPLPIAPISRKLNGMAKKLGQFSIAASVAFTVLFGVSQVQDLLPGSANSLAPSGIQMADAASSMPELGGDFNPSELSRTVSMDAAARDRIQRAVRQFSGSSAPVPFNAEAYTFPVQSEPEEASQ
jgi:negative regulator of sigma E activity